jgi:hypothetical protein
MRTVAELFRSLEEQRIAYAVLRNYEHLPELRRGDLGRNTDIDLVVDSVHMARFRELLISLATRFDWDLLTECEHFQRSRARHHNIEIFQFYRLEPIEYLQVDVFHGYLAWGLPLMDEREMLCERVQDRPRKLTRIDPIKETAFRLLQVHGLGLSEKTAEKRARYQDRIEAFCHEREEELLTSLRRYLGPFGVHAVAALRTGDTRRFRRVVPLGKTWFFARRALRHPVSTLWHFVERCRENYARFYGDPCGCVLAAHAVTEQARSRFRIAMDKLIELSVLDEWVDAGEAIEGRNHNVLEQGGIVVKWTDRDGASVVAEADDHSDGIALKVLKAYMFRHRTLYAKAETRRVERRLSAVQV